MRARPDAAGEVSRQAAPLNAAQALPLDWPHGQLPKLRRGEPTEVPSLRLLRRRAGGRAGRPLPVREMRKTVTMIFSDLKDSTALGRAPRFRGAARGQGPLLHGHGRRDHAPRRQDREVHRRRDHGRVRAAQGARGRRAARGARRGRHAQGAGARQRRPDDSATAWRWPTAPASTPARWWPTTTRRPTRSWPPATRSTWPRGWSRPRRWTRSTSAKPPTSWCATRSRSRPSSR